MSKKKNKIVEKDYGMDDIEMEIIEEEPRAKIIMNIIFIIIIALGIMIIADVVCVIKYDKGPYFAIRTKVYDDGGTEVYYGLGYKVIKYHQEQGRRDTQLGLWTMKYNTKPTEVEALDLAIEFRNAPEDTAKKYAHQFVRITGRIYIIKDDEIILRYHDPDDYYTLKIKCPLAEKTDLSSLEKGMETTVLGTIDSFTLKTKKNPNQVNMSNCFTE